VQAVADPREVAADTAAAVAADGPVQVAAADVAAAEKAERAAADTVLAPRDSAMALTITALTILTFTIAERIFPKRPRGNPAAPTIR
jgi:hypothetical protein